MRDFLYKITSRVCGRSDTLPENRSANPRHGFWSRAHVAVLLIGICLLACGSLVIVRAADGDLPGLTFTNENDDTLSLTVTKTVTNTSGSDAPDDTFTFKILKGGAVDDKLTYTLYDASGEELLQVYYLDKDNNYVDADEKSINEPIVMTKSEVAEIGSNTKYVTEPYAPDSSGRFTLKAGQKAVFMSNNMIVDTEYKVTEVTNDKDDNGNDIVTFETTVDEKTVSYYYQPEAANINVTIAGDSAENTAAFDNTYYPPTTEAKTCTVTVGKKIIGVSGYDLPTTQTFTYMLVIGGYVYKNQAYSVYSSEDNKKLETGKTNASGEFTLEGGQYATFEDVNTNQEYTVYEYAKSGWWCVGGTAGVANATVASDGKVTVVSDTADSGTASTSSVAAASDAETASLAAESTSGGTTITYAEKRTGVTKNPTQQQFTNRCGSFIVKKSIQSGQTAGDMEFRFVLKDENGKAWAYQTFYVYDTNGKLVKTDAQKTGANGSFTLQANQAAMFVGIEQGVKYTVEETASPLYEVVTPKSGSYTKTVGETVESLPFTNRVLENQGLYVRKIVENEPAVSTTSSTTTTTTTDGTNASEASVSADDGSAGPDTDGASEADVAASADETQAALAEDGAADTETTTTLDGLSTEDTNNKRLYTFRLVKVDSDGNETEVNGETYGKDVASNLKGTSISFTAVAFTDANGESDTIHVFQLTSDDYAHFTKLSSGEYRVYEYKIDKSVVATAKYTAAESGESDDSMSFEVYGSDNSDGTRNVKLANTFTVDKNAVQELAVTNTYTKEMFMISKTILDYNGNKLETSGAGSGNSQIEAGGDTSQRFVYRIEKYTDRKAWDEGKGTPVSTTYTDFSCDATGEGSVLVQGNGKGWYVITEMDTWSKTDYDYKSESYLQGNTEQKSTSDEKYTHAANYVAFQLDQVYDAYNLPTAHFENIESPYAFRSGQAYAENHMILGY